MTSYRRALSTVLYVVGCACLLLATFASARTGVGLLFITAIVCIVLAIKYDERL